MKGPKNYVLDTNILLTSPRALLGFDDNNVILTGTTVQELDRKKTEAGEVGYNAREAIRLIEACREKGNLVDGVPLENGGKLYVKYLNIDETVVELPDDFSLANPDNRIILTILNMVQPGYMDGTDGTAPAVLVSNDTSMRINASLFGIRVESYRNDHVASRGRDYLGWRTVHARPGTVSMLNMDGQLALETRAVGVGMESGMLYVMPDEAPDGQEPPELCENEYLVIMEDDGKGNVRSALGMVRGGVVRIVDPCLFASGIRPRNTLQSFALDALLAPPEEIPFVILKGAAGSAKTLLSLAAGLDGTYGGDRYNRLLISRNNVTSDAEFGFMPGGIDDKMRLLLNPFFDNLDTILRSGGPETNEQVQMQIDDLFASRVIQVFPLAYMRGSSIPYSFLIVDEAQNSTRTQMRDIVTRAGEHTKVVVCGDPDQIDNHVLDRYNNGLVYAAERFRGSRYCAQLTFTEKECVRSELAMEALRRMKP